MEREKFLGKAKKVGGTTSVKILETDHIDSDYTAKLWPNQKATDTGLVKIGELAPKPQTLPTFTVRWDEKQDTLDVDIYVGGKLANSLWNESGYQGHHPKKWSGRSQQYVLDVWIPGRQIFKGSIDVGLAHELCIRGGVLSLEGYAPILRIGPAAPP